MMTNKERTFVLRASRFPFRIPMRYLKNGESQWHDAQTINISRTGLLINTTESFPENSEMDIKVFFPTKAVLTCRGAIVRTQPAAVAVRIHHSHMSHS